MSLEGVKSFSLQNDGGHYRKPLIQRIPDKEKSGFPIFDMEHFHALYLSAAQDAPVNEDSWLLVFHYKWIRNKI